MVSQFELVSRVFLAACIGGCIGYERHNRAKVAGIRTHSIVAMASAAFTIVSIYGFAFADAKWDAARVASSVVSGIGFLGAGIIYVRNDAIHGLTTAAGVWATAAVGMCIGTGMYLIGAASAICILATQMIFHHPSYNGDLNVTMALRVKMRKTAGIREVMDELERIGCTVIMARVVADPGDDNAMIMQLNVSHARGLSPDYIMKAIQKMNHVLKVTLS